MHDILEIVHPKIAKFSTLSTREAKKREPAVYQFVPLNCYIPTEPLFHFLLY